MKHRVIRQERGWGGHFIAASSCLFRRNTLLTCGDVRIVVSTVGLMKVGQKFEEIGYKRYFETMAFHSNPNDHRYHDADVSRPVEFTSEWAISEPDADDKANDMHEAVVKEITLMLETGTFQPNTINDDSTEHTGDQDAS